MLPATNRGAGMNIGFPDVCLTPAGPAVVPIPYPNFALTAQAAVFSPVVRISGVNALNLASIISMTSGDEAGVAHWTVKGPGRYIMGNPIVFVDRLPAINLTCPTMGNTGNNPIGAVLVPSAVNVFYTYTGQASPSLTPSAAAELGDQISGRLSEHTIVASMHSETVALVRVNLITTDMTRQFFVAMTRLQQMGAREVIIDLRGCPGGDLDGAVEWAGSFLNEGSEIVRIEDAEGDELVRRANLPPQYAMPVVIFVNESTASAAEMFAASLQTHQRARIIGQPTYGKTTVQHLAPGATSSFEYPTVARWSITTDERSRKQVLPDNPLPEGCAEQTWFDSAIVAFRL